MSRRAIFLSIFLFLLILFSVLFLRSCRQPHPAIRPEIGTPAPAKPATRVALVYDDVGYGHRKSLERALKIKAKQTFAVIPFSERDGFFTKMILAGDGEVLLHLPMPSEEAHPGQAYPGGVEMKDSPAQVEARIAADLARVPGALGVNNHQGSKGTADERLMGLVLGAIQRRGLFFLDSRTTTQSKARALAAKRGVPFAERAVFLDNKDEAGAIRSELGRLVRRARKRGEAVGIGHLRDITVQVLESEIPRLQAEGIEFVFVSDLVRVPTP